MDATLILNKLIQKNDLSFQEISFLLNGVIDGNISPVQAGALLTALSMKGETASEVTDFIKVMKRKMTKIKAANAIDVCGTGGDGSGSFNISTAAAFVVAGSGVRVAKHGNRAASSKCGSADVLEELGVNINLNASEAGEVLEKVGMVFLFAPLFHPATKNVVTIRKELKIKTVFNFLGPFLNPASVQRQLIGVANEDTAEKLIQVGAKLGYKHLLIVTSEDKLDEISIFAKTHAFEFKDNKISRFTIDPKDYGFSGYKREEIKEGTLAENAEFIRQILNGEKGARKDIVVLNAGAALYVSGKAKDILQGIKMAEESIDSGEARKVLEGLIKETKKYEK